MTPQERAATVADLERLLVSVQLTTTPYHSGMSDKYYLVRGRDPLFDSTDVKALKLVIAELKAHD